MLCLGNCRWAAKMNNPEQPTELRELAEKLGELADQSHSTSEETFRKSPRASNGWRITWRRNAALGPARDNEDVQVNGTGCGRLSRVEQAICQPCSSTKAVLGAARRQLQWKNRRGTLHHQTVSIIETWLAEYGNWLVNSVSQARG